jgi:hypothetical protein
MVKLAVAAITGERRGAGAYAAGLYQEHRRDATFTELHPSSRERLRGLHRRAAQLRS